MPYDKKFIKITAVLYMIRNLRYRLVLAGFLPALENLEKWDNFFSSQGILQKQLIVREF